MASNGDLHRTAAARNKQQRARASALRLKARWHRLVTRRRASKRIESSRAKMREQVKRVRKRARKASERQRDERDRAQAKARDARKRALKARNRQAERARRRRGAGSGG